MDSYDLHRAGLVRQDSFLRHDGRNYKFLLLDFGLELLADLFDVVYVVFVEVQVLRWTASTAPFLFDLLQELPLILQSLLLALLLDALFVLPVLLVSLLRLLEDLQGLRLLDLSLVAALAHLLHKLRLQQLR